LSAEVCGDGGGSARDSSILEASQVAEQKGEGRGDPGLFIAGFCLAETENFCAKLTWEYVVNYRPVGKPQEKV
jgi:hypothetical protein